MARVTTIKWREYPNEKPTRGGWYTILANGKIIGRECYNLESEWANDYNISSTRGIVITHFALPQDITTVTEEKDG